MEREGTLLGNYRLTNLVGQGGFADVYLAEHLLLNTPAAIKVLRTTLLSENEMESFLHEARIIARLNHPHIVRVLDFGIDEIGDTPYLVMEYAEHGTLRQKYPAGSRQALSTILPYVKQIAEALQYAHDAKLVHRDVKPENMLLGQNEKVLLSDFGVSLLARTTRSGNAEEAVGTVAYMAPEQIEGKTQPAGDQYALAVIVYEWLTGHPPFQGSIREICTQHLFGQVPSLRSQGVWVSSSVEEVLWIALAKDPKERFGGVQEFAQALERAFLQPVSLPGASSSAFAGTSVETGAAADGSARSALLVAGAPTIADADTFELAAVPAKALADIAGHKNIGAEKHKNAATGTGVKAFALSPKRLALVGTLVLLLVLASIGFGMFGGQNPGYGLESPAHSAAIATRNALATMTPGAVHPPGATQTTGPAHATATPGKTATATSSPTATATSPAPNLFTQITATTPTFSDALSKSDGNGWYQDGGCGFSSGHYTVSAITTNAFNYCLGPTTNYTNFIYQAQVSIAQGGYAGIVFRTTLPYFYYVTISAHATYHIYYSTQDGTPGTLLASGSSSALVTGLNQPNRVAVLVQGSALALYLNGQYVTSVSDSRIAQGQIGLIALPGSSNTTADFNNVQVWVI